MTILFKGLTRPAMIFGVPILPLVVSIGGCALLSVYISKLMLFLIPVVVIKMRYMAKADERFFDLILLKLKCRGNGTANRYYGANSLLAQKYDSVDVKEFIDSMKLNQRAAIEDKIPYSSHVDDFIVKTKTTDLISTWEVSGTAFECESERSLDIITEQINTLIKSFSGVPVTVYTHHSRFSFYDSFSSDSGNAFADKVSTLYYGGIKNNQFRANNIYVTICYQPFGRIERAESKSLSLDKKKSALNSTIKSMKEIRNRFETALLRFGARPLGLYEEGAVVYSSQISFYNYLLTGRFQKIRISKTPLYALLGNADVFFSSDAGQVKSALGSRFFRCIEIKDWVSDTVTGIYDCLLYADCDYVLTQSYTAMSKSEALESIKDAEKKLRSAEDDAVSQRDELILSRDQLMSGEIGFGKYHFSLMVYADTINDVVRDTNKLISMLTDLGFIVTLSTISLPAAFCAQMPGVYSLRPRLVPVSSKNFAEMASFHNFYRGKRDLNPWGEAIAILKTPSGQPYYLNLHNSVLMKNEYGEKTLGNTSVIGTAGVGKTMTLNFIATMLQKYAKPESFADTARTKRQTTVYFDKDRGAELSVRALGGQYYTVKNGHPTGWNPFQLEKTKRNVAFIKQLMALCVTRTSADTLNTRQAKQLHKAVDAVMDFPKESRINGVSRLLENINEPATKEARDNGLKIRLSQWAKGGEFGWVFDNENDTFDIGDCDNFGIDGTEFLDDENVCSPISFYLIYRVTQLLDGRRLVMFFDEFWKWLSNKAFSDFVYNKLKTIRKLNGLVVPATQSPDEILKSDISAAVIEVCSTKIFLANPDATEKDYIEGFKVTQEEFDIIKGLDPQSRQFLIKKSPLKKGDLRSFSALVTMDLSGLGVYTKVLSASVDNLEIFDSIFREGMKPEEWLDTFIEQAI